MQLFYREKGIDTHPPLIILHGLWGASDNWLPVADLLSHRFHVILPDLRNHGCSPHSSLFDYTILSQDTEELIGRLNLPQRPFLAGHSLGGKTLMHLVLKRPEIVEKAAIIDICPQAYTLDKQTMHRSLSEYILTTPLQNFHRRQEIHRAVREYFSTEEEVQILLKNIRKTPQGYEWKVNAKAIRENLSSLLDWNIPDIRSPYQAEILFIKAGHSDYLPEKITEATRYYFPKARQKTIPEATHRIHVDQPLRLAHTLSDYFLAP